MSNLELSEVQGVIELIATELGGSGRLKKNTAQNVFNALISVGRSAAKIPIKDSNEIPCKWFLDDKGLVTIQPYLAGYKSGKGTNIDSKLDKVRKNLPKNFKLN